MSESIRIAVAMHKPYRTPDDPAYLPLHVGAALHPDVLPGIQGDDEGDNISRLNASYSELTALYWMWKNCDADYKGLVHYRRLFASPSLANRLRKDRFVRIASGKEIREALKKTGAVVPRRRNYYIETMRSHYAHTLDGSHLDVMRDILMSKAPEYVPMFDRCMASTSGHMFNMLVMRADLFDAYCVWLFPLIDELTKRIDASAYTPFEKRYPGRVSELLLDVWLKTNGQDVVELSLTSRNRPTGGKGHGIPHGQVRRQEIREELLIYIGKSERNQRSLFILFFVISVFTIYLDYSAHKDISSPVIVFTSLWLFICTLASLRLYGFTGYSEKTIGYITCGSVAFSLGAFSSTLVNKQTTKQTRYAHLRGKNLQTSDGNQQQLCFTFLEIILALACVGSALSLFYSLNAFRSGASYMEVRGSRLGYNDEQAFSNPIVGLFVTYFCGPAMTVLIPIAIVFLFKKQHKKFSLIVFCCALMNTVSSGGRIQIIYIALQLIAAFLYYKRAITAKTKRTIKIAVIVGIVALFVLTSLRTSQNFLQAIYTYFTLPVGLFSYYTSIVDVNNFESFGAATFYPLFYVLASVASFLEPNVVFG